MTLKELIDTGIRDAFQTEQETDSRAGIVIDWVLTCEIAGVDGEMYLHNLRSTNLLPWKALGMIEAHAGDLRAGMLEVDDDD